MGLLRKPPTMQKDLLPLSIEQLGGFKLNPGKLSDEKSSFSSSHRKKKKRREDGEGIFHYKVINSIKPVVTV